MKIQIVGHSNNNKRKDGEDAIYEMSPIPKLLTANIPQPFLPIFMPFRYCCAGGTMLIRRLCVYLRDIGYEVKVIKDFLTVKNYNKAADYYEQSLDSLERAGSNSWMDQYLIEVTKNGKPICYMLDMQGERQAPWPLANPDPLFLHITNGDNPIIWGIIIEKEMESRRRDNYYHAIAITKKQMKPNDKVIIIFNKIDETPYMLSPCTVNQKGALDYARKMYPSLFALFQRANFFYKLINPYNCDFVTFSSGYYSPTDTWDLCYTRGNNYFPMTLWDHIIKLCK